eukprot:TRINITY_DN4970_c0_g1_i1.p1 TRINITY_DN4970_c0_g1~~TRINITY_DN4970_c0_g1_i1.p1  ORF type:complete len:1390 (+),score=514.97 TRINITY_DN4970_c0_g1_i1:98-4267(+)
MAIEPGALVYFNHSEEHSWILGKVKDWDSKKKIGTCVSEDEKHPGLTTPKLKEEQIFPVSKDVLGEDVDDLLSLTILHDSTLLACLKVRYFRDVIYTNIGAIVVAINPFNFKIPRYMDDQMPKYLSEGDRIEHNLPHSWAVAHNTYYEMINADPNDTTMPVNQCILVSGESGAGKTEASKIVMKYLGAVSCKRADGEEKAAAQGVGQKINICSPILECFGNAKTVRNDNSSRFGKFLKVQFDERGMLVGAFAIKYLLEKSRIVTAAKGERVYHSFYVACRGDDAFRGKYNIGVDNTYASLAAGGTYENKEFNKPEDLIEVLDAMTAVDMSADEIDGVWRGVGGVLHVENTKFLEDGEGNKLDPATEKFVGLACGCWGVDAEVMKREFKQTTLKIPGGTVDKQLKPYQAGDGRDALVKTLYDQIFGWLVDKINQGLDVGDKCQSWVGLLDIFGFEDFETGNYFEQLCINLANESIQGHYNTFIFEKDMDECRAEGIDVANIIFPDNKPCIKMIAGKGGILALLDEECSLGSGTDHGWMDKVAGKFKEEKRFFEKKSLAKDHFVVKHYAGNVSYDCRGALDKNRDTLKDANKLLMRASTNSFIAQMIDAPVEKSGKKISVGGFFKQQLTELMDLICSTNPHWIRCVKPHPAKKPLMLHGVSTMGQLGSSGVLGTVQIRKAGYPVRLPFDIFWPKYQVIAKAAGNGEGIPKEGQSQDGCKAVLDATLKWGDDMFQYGKTRVFLKAHAYIELEKEKKVALGRSAIVVQSICRQRLSLPMVRKKRWEASCRIIQEEFRDFMIRCADIRAERDRIRKELQAKHQAEIEALTAEAYVSLDPIYEEFEAPLANWKKQMHQEAIDLEKMIAQYGASRQAIRDDHAKGAAVIEQQADADFVKLQATLMGMLLSVIDAQEECARAGVKKEEKNARAELALTLEAGFAMVHVLIYLDTEVGFRQDIEELERCAWTELQTRWNIMSLQKSRWEDLLGVMVPKCKAMQKGIAKYQQKLKLREDIVRERQMLEANAATSGLSLSASGKSAGVRTFVQCMSNGRPVVVPMDGRVDTKGLHPTPWLAPNGLPSADQVTSATKRTKDELSRLRLPQASAASLSPSTSPMRTTRSSHGAPTSPKPRLPSGSLSPRSPGNRPEKTPAWESISPQRYTHVDPSQGINHSVVGVSAAVLQKMGEQNPMFKQIFFSSRDECASQLKWLRDEGAYPTEDYIDPTDIVTLKELKSAEALLRKYKAEYCEDQRKELRRLNAICKECNVPDKHPVTQQLCRLPLSHKSLTVQYPPTTDVFRVVEEVKRLGSAILDHKKVVLKVLLAANKQKLLPPGTEVTSKLTYHKLKLILDKAKNIQRYDGMVRCQACHSFFRDTAARCWNCGGPGPSEFSKSF